MIIDFDHLEETVIPHFRGGEKETRSRMYTDENNKIMRGKLEPGTFSDQFDGRRNDDGEYVIGQGKWNCNVTTVSGDLRISRFGI